MRCTYHYVHATWAGARTRVDMLQMRTPAGARKVRQALHRIATVGAKVGENDDLLKWVGMALFQTIGTKINLKKLKILEGVSHGQDRPCLGRPGKEIRVGERD